MSTKDSQIMWFLHNVDVYEEQKEVNIYHGEDEWEQAVQDLSHLYFAIVLNIFDSIIIIVPSMISWK